MSGPNFWEMCAREKLNRGPDWLMVQWELVGNTDDAIVRGAVPEGVYTRGFRKGQPKFKAPFKDRCVVTRSDIAARMRLYESETNQCAKCGGSGAEWAGWDSQTGHRGRECTRCKGSGKPQESQP